MAQLDIKQIKGASQGSILFLGTNSVVSEDYNGLNWSYTNNILYVGGQIQIVDGNQQSGYVLTTDANGLATWSQFPEITETRTIGTYSTTSNITTDVALAYTNTSSFTLYLPTAVGITGSEYTIKDRDGNANTNNIIISGTLSQLIDGSSTYTMRLNYESITLISDGLSWWII